MGKKSINNIASSESAVDYTRDISSYYGDCHGFDKHVGFSLKFNIRNHQQHKVQLVYRGGLTTNIRSRRDDYQANVNDLLSTVFIDVEVFIEDMMAVNFDQMKKSNSNIDNAIIARIQDHVKKARMGSYLAGEESTRMFFAIPVGRFKPNLGRSGYYSELLGVIINLNCNRPYDYVSNFPESYLSAGGNPSTKEGTLFDSNDATFVHIHLIDNKNEIGQLWTMQCGEPVKIKKSYNQALDSGLYIFNNESYHTQQRYIFVPIYELDSDKLTALGISDSRKELLTECKTKEYVELQKENVRLKEKLRENEKLLAKIEQDKHLENLRKTGEEQKTLIQIDALNRKLEKANTTIEQMKREEGSNRERLTDAHKREVEALKREGADMRASHKRELSDIQQRHELNEEKHKREIGGLLQKREVVEERYKRDLSETNARHEIEMLALKRKMEYENERRRAEEQHRRHIDESKRLLEENKKAVEQKNDTFGFFFNALKFFKEILIFNKIA